MTFSMEFLPSLDSAGTHVALRLPHRATRVRAGRLRSNGDGPRAKWIGLVDPSINASYMNGNMVYPLVLMPVLMPAMMEISMEISHQLCQVYV
jgi:hypothetical protein